MFPINEKAPVFTEAFIAANIEISNQLISDLLEFVEVVEELINADSLRKMKFQTCTIFGVYLQQSSYK